MRARSGKHLAELIAAKTPLITAVVNKLDNAATWFQNTGTVDDDPDIFVLVDESHRSHSAAGGGEYGTFARRMRRMLPNASYLGFTGTPLLKREKNTYRTFGAPIHSYTIADAVGDEAVVPLLYEGRDVQKQIAPSVLDAWFDKICQGLSPEQRADLKRKFSRSATLSSAGQVVWAKAFDISEHYRQHWQATGFKAQLVAPTKAAAIRYKQVLDEIGHVSSEVVISAPGDEEVTEASDRESRELVQQFWAETMTRFGSEAEYNRDVVARFKSRQNPEILVVVSKLLTGFDAPRNTVLYVCRSLREHTLLQAIARVNRLFEPDEEGGLTKEFGYIVDYEGLLGELDAALTAYSALSDFDLDELIGAVVDVRSEISKLDARWSAVWALFAGLTDMEAMEQHLEPEDVRDEFTARLADFTQTLRIALSSDKVDDLVPTEASDRYRRDWQLFVDLRRSAAYRYLDRVDLSEYEPKIQRLLDDHLTALPAEIVVPEVNLNDQASLRAVVEAHGPSAAAKADRIASATKRRITERMAEDPALYERFAKLVQEAIDAHRAHRLSEIDYLNRMVDVASAVERGERGERGRSLPVAVRNDPAAASVFEAIARSFASVLMPNGHAPGEDSVGQIAVQLVDIIRDHHIVGIWENRDRQNDLLNALDDFLWDVVEGEQGIALDPETEASVRDTVMSIAQARFP